MANQTSYPTEPYRNMTPSELLKQYSPSVWNNRGLTPDDAVKAHVEETTTVSDRTVSEFSIEESLSYGPSDKQKLDIILPDTLNEDCPILVYIHGGYWKALGRELSTFPAGPLLNAGAAFVAVGYDLAPNVTVRQIVAQVREAVLCVARWAKKRGLRRVYLCGHSAGGHLAAMVLKEKLNCDGIIKGALLVSGVYDLRPLVDTAENDELHLTKQEAWEVSPFHHIEQLAQTCLESEVSLCVAVGQSDSPEFRRQSQEFYQVLSNNKVDVTLHDVPGTDHFTVIERLSSPQYTLTQVLLTLMNLRS